jgi:hypothetical protein
VVTASKSLERSSGGFFEDHVFAGIQRTNRPVEMQ